MYKKGKNTIKKVSTVLFLVIFFCFPIAVTFGATLQNTNPTGDQSLTLSGNVEVGEVVWVNNVLQVRTRANGTGAVRPMQIKTGANTGIYMDTSGNVGINDTTPSARLDVDGDVAQSGSILSSMGSWSTVASSTPNWYTVGYLGSGRGYGEFFVENTQSSQHQALKFIASIQYGGGPQITVLENSYFSTVPFTKIRIARLSADTTYGAYAVQVYGYDLYGTGTNNRVRISNPGTHGWTVKNFTTAENASYVATTVEVNIANQTMTQSGNLYVVGNVSSGGAIVANVSAPNVSGGTFGTTAGKGNYTFEAAANTNNVLKVDATNERVGVGTGSPGYKLHVNAGAVYPLYLTSTQRYLLGLNYNSDTTKEWWLGSDTNGNFFVHENGIGDRVTIQDATGYVGIGTTSPSSRLHAYQSTGETQIKIESADNHASLQINAATAAFPYIRFSQGGTGRFEMGKVASNGNFYFNNAVANGESGAAMVISTSGSVGIGTNSPGTNKLHVYNGSSGGTPYQTGGLVVESNTRSAIQLLHGNTTDAYLFFGDANAGNRGYVGHYGSAMSPANLMTYYSFGNHAFSGGNVGIGTTTPTSALHVIGDIRASGNVIAGGTMTANVSAPNVSAGTFGTTAGKGNYTFEAAANTNNVLKVDATNERVGIGTGSPGYKLDVWGSAWNNIARIYSTGSSSGLEFYDTNGTRRGVAYSDSSGFGLLGSATSWAIKIPYGTNNVLFENGTVIGNNKFVTKSDTPANNRFEFQASDGSTRAYLEHTNTNYSTTPGRIDFYAENISSVPQLALSVTGNGSVGVGTTAPSKRFEVGIADNNAADGAGGNWWLGSAGYDKTYATGEATCIAGGGRLAYYSEIVDAWRNGANSCSWGWIKEGFIVYPMQDGAAAGCGGAVGGVRQMNPALTDLYSVYCARDNQKTYGTINATGIVDSKGFSVSYGQTTTSVGYFGLTGNGTNADKMVLSVGTSSKTYAVNVQGDIRATGNIIAGGTMTANVGAPNVSAGTFGTTAGKGNYTFEAAANTNNVLKVDATNERVGVGTASPGAKLHVKGGDVYIQDGSGDGATYRLRLKGNSTTGNGEIGVASAYNLLLQTGSGETGSVGINTASPGAKLHVQLDTNNVDIIRASTAAHSIGLGIDSGSSYWGASIFQDGTKRFTVESNNGILVGSAYQSVDAPANGAIIEGNVGIGTSVPTSYFNTNASYRIGGIDGTSKILAIQGASGTPSVLNLTNTLDVDGGTIGGVLFTRTGGQGDAHLNIAGIVGLQRGTGTAAGSEMRFWVKGASSPFTAMVINTNGYIGIGTTTPVNALDVVGNIRATGNIIAGGTMTANVGAPNVSGGTFGTTAGKGNYTFEAAANTNNVLKVDATNERVGIGTGSPAYKLDVSGDIRSTGDVYVNGSDILLSQNGSGYATVGLQGTASGLYVGVNLKNDGAKQADANVAWRSLYINTGDQYQIQRSAAGTATWTTPFIIDGLGNVGIGTTSPGAKLSVHLNEANGNTVPYINMYNDASGYVDWSFKKTGSNDLTIYDAYQNLPLMTWQYVNGGGNIGIGTLTPDAKLAVAGTTRINGSFAANGTGFYFSPSSEHYQPASNIPITMIRSDDAATTPENTLSGLVLYNANGGQNTGANITFASREAVGAGNDVALSGIFGWKVSAGTAGSWSSGGLKFWVKNGGPVIEALSINSSGNATFPNPVAVGSPVAVNDATTKSYVDSLVTGGATSGNLATLIVTGTTTLASTGGKVIIGGAGPSLKLDVTGQGQFTDTMSATKYYDYNDTAYYLDPANTGTALYVNGAIQSNNASPTSYIMGNTLIGVSTNPGSYKFAVSGTSYFNNQMTVNANLVMGASQNITLSSGNILGINKITAALIDPLYQIGGENYSTFGAAIAGGLYEEFIGRGTLSRTYPVESIKYENKDTKYDIQNTNYSYTIDFTKVERGSDLWVWYNVVDFSEDTVQAIVTPIGENANIYYEIKDKKIIFKAMMNDEFRISNEGKGIAFSFRLSGKRHDHKEWPTYSKDQTEKPSFILKEK